MSVEISNIHSDVPSSGPSSANFEVIGFGSGHDGATEQIFQKFLDTCCRRPRASSLSAKPSIAPPTFLQKLLRGESAQWYSELTLVPVIEMFGVTRTGQSVLVHVHGFFPYVYIPLPEGLTTTEVRDVLNTKLEGEGGVAIRSSNRQTGAILKAVVVERYNLMHYTGEEKSRYLQLWLSSPRLVAAIRRIVTTSKIDVTSQRTGERVSLASNIFEANFPHELRFMVDLNIVGCSWVTIPEDKYLVRDSSNALSHCQWELDIFYEDLLARPPQGEYQAIPPLRVLSLDIECVTATGKGFPSAAKDPIIQISVSLATGGTEDVPLMDCVFTLLQCAPLSGATILWFNSEKDLLYRFSQLLLATDPDIITGFNVINFDLNYILDRVSFYSNANSRSAFYLSRMKNVVSTARNTVLSSRALGTHENKDINIEGRVQMDMLEVVRREHKLKSYTLNAVAAHFLKQQKEDVHYSQLFDLHYGSPETRARIAKYCLKDAQLPLRIMSKLLIAVNYIEMARVTGVTLTFLLTRGQQIKVTSQLLRKCRDEGFLFPTWTGRSNDDSKYEGATVLEPMKGLYREPIATLDFASLYPSIMIVRPVAVGAVPGAGAKGTAKLSSEDVTTTPVGCMFVKPSVRRGILPTVVQELIEARQKARAEMKNTEDPFTRMVLNGRQLALKISANSVYGYTGAAVSASRKHIAEPVKIYTTKSYQSAGQLPCLEVSTSITAYGREMIDLTKSSLLPHNSENCDRQFPYFNEVEKHFRRDNGYEENAVVVYGDTDSVMVKFGTKDIKRAMELGLEAATLVSQRFIPPIRLEFEKVFCPFLLMNKKRYAGLIYTDPTQHAKIDCKGIETVRRDFCLFVQQLVDTILKRILVDDDPDGALEYTKQIIADLLQNKIDMSLLVMSKSLGKEDYTNKRLAHVELARKLAERDPNNAPQTGDRVHYVIIAGAKGQPQYDRAEDPLYALEHNLGIDTAYYLETMKNPIARVFEGLNINVETLFSGAHTTKRRVLTPSTSGLSKFVKTSLRCLGCRSVIKATKNVNPESALCEHCAVSKPREIILEKIEELRVKENEFCQLWTECQRCQGSVTQDVLCTSRDCPIFYRRVKAFKDISEAESIYMFQNDVHITAESCTKGPGVLAREEENGSELML